MTCLTLPSRTAVVALAAACFSPGAGAQTSGTGSNLVLNGSFESLASGWAPPAGDVTTLFGGDTALTGWTVGASNSIDIHDSGHTNAHDGQYSIDLAGIWEPGSISQSIATDVGAWYRLSFWRAGHSFHPYAGPAKMEVSWGGALQGEIGIAAAATSQSMNWTYTEYLLQASSTTTVLGFIGRSVNGGTLIDTVRLEAAASPIPEPAAAWMLLSGLPLLALARRGRRAAGAWLTVEKTRSIP